MPGSEVILRVTGDSGGLTRAFKEADKQAAASMAKIEASVRAANTKMASTIDTSSGKIGRMRASVAENAAALSIAEREQVRLTARYGEGSVQADRAALAVRRLTAAHAFSTAELHAAEAAMAQRNLGWRNLAATSTSVSEVVRTKLGAMSASMAAAGTNMRTAGSRMTRSVSLPLGIIGTLGIKTAMDYEKSMNVLRQVTKAGVPEMDALATLARALGADLTLPGTSAADAAKTMTELAKAGLDVNQIMAATKGVLQMSAAGGIENAEAAMIAANALNAFGLKGEQTTRVADMMASVADASSLSIKDVADSMNMAGGVFGQAGIPIEDFITSLGLMAKFGYRGSDAGTALKTMLLRLNPSSKEAQKLMEKLHLSAYDTAGGLKPMRTIVAEVTQAMSNMSDQERSTMGNTIFGTDAIRTQGAVLAAGADSWDKMRALVLREGYAAEAAAVKNEGLAGALDAIKSSMETLAIVVIAPLLTKMAEFAVKLADLISRFSDLPKPVQNAALVFGAFLAVAGPLVYIGGILATVLSGVAAAVGFLLAPVGLVVAAVAALGVGLVLAYQRFEGFRNVVNSVAVAVGQTFMLAVTDIGNAIAAIRTALGVFFTDLGTIWNIAWTGLKDTVSGLFDGVIGIVKGSINTVIGIINTLIGAYNKLPFVSDVGKIAPLEMGGGKRSAPLTAPHQTDTAARPTGAITGGRVIPLAKGGTMLGVRRPTQLLVGERHHPEDVYVAPHSKGGIGALGGHNTTNNFYGITYEEAATRAQRQEGWRMALMGRR